MSTRGSRAFVGMMFALALGSGEAWAAKRPEPAVIAAAQASPRPEARRLLEDALAAAPVGPEADAVRVHLAELLRVDGAPELARPLYDAVANSRDDTPWREPARLGLALLDAATGDERALSRLIDSSDKEGIPPQNVDKWLLVAASRSGDPGGAAKALDAARDAARGDAALLSRIETTAAGLGAPPPTGTPLERAEKALAAGRLDDARRQCDEIRAVAPSSEEAFVCGYLVKRITAAPVNPAKIGVLLPLSGKFGTVGAQIREALLLGYGAADTKRHLVFVDSGDTAESAVPALEALVLEQGVVAVVGPLRTEMTAEVARVADALRVPLVGLSPSDDGASRPWVRQAMVTPQEQVAGLIAYCVDKRGMDAFATFAPDTAYGHAAAAAFKAEVARRGLALRAEVFYDAEATNLAPYAKTLARRNDADRTAELARLRQEARAAGKDPAKVVLPPTIDYDAIFLPDSANRVPIATAGLGYEEFPIGGFQPKKGMATMPLLGLSGWNSDTLASRAQPYIKGGLFTDAYVRASAPAFEETFQAATQRAPSPLEAVTYDIGKLLAAAAKADAADRPAFLAALDAARATDTATGTDRFEADRTAAHRIRVLSVGTNGVYAADE